jgi:N-methylhydantoinase B
VSPGAAGANTALDPITVELIQTRLSSIVREMRTVIIRTAYSPMIIEGHDFSSAVLTMEGDLVAASELEQPTHISALSWSARGLVRKYRDDIGPGDLYLHNDPYTGGSHLNDVGLFYPVFRAGTPLALVGVMAHWQDVGGMVPGSLSGNARDIFQEGLRMPSIRIARRGQPIQEALDLIFANVRQPEDRMGDLRAMEGACGIAERRLLAMAERFGEATIRAALDALLDRAEQRMRAAIRTVPDGRYRYETWLDNSGESPRPLRLRLELTVRDDSIHADFAGCAPQVLGPANLGPAPATTAVFTMTKALLDPAGPISAGALRPLTVSAPLGTVVNARPPAACGAIGEVRRALEALVAGTLGQAIPDRLVGDLKGASNITSISGHDDRRGRDFVFAEFPAGGTGAVLGLDGNNALRNFAEGDISSIQPIEAVELVCPLRVERMALRPDSGGAGVQRGGLGLQREIRVLGSTARLSVLSDKNLIPPYGVRVGGPGARNRFTVRREGREIEPSAMPGKVTGFALQRDDVVIERTAGGGGYGDPLERDPRALARDVAFGYVRASTAREVYGVVLAGGQVDMAATEALRRTLRARRSHVGIEARADEAQDGARCIIDVPGALAIAMGLKDDDLVELPAQDGPSLLCWVRIDPSLPMPRCRMSAAAIASLGTAQSGLRELRPIRSRLEADDDR